MSAKRNNAPLDHRPDGSKLPLAKLKETNLRRDGDSLAEVAAAIESYCRKRMGLDFSMLVDDEIVESVRDSVIMRILANDYPEVGTPNFWSAVSHDLLDAIRSIRRRNRLFKECVSRQRDAPSFP